MLIIHPTTIMFQYIVASSTSSNLKMKPAEIFQTCRVLAVFQRLILALPTAYCHLSSVVYQTSCRPYKESVKGCILNSKHSTSSRSHKSPNTHCSHTLNLTFTSFQNLLSTDRYISNHDNLSQRLRTVTSQRIHPIQNPISSCA